MNDPIDITWTMELDELSRDTATFVHNLPDGDRGSDNAFVLMRGDWATLGKPGRVLVKVQPT